MRERRERMREEVARREKRVKSSSDSSREEEEGRWMGDKAFLETTSGKRMEKKATPMMHPMKWAGRRRVR